MQILIFMTIIQRKELKVEMMVWIVDDFFVILDPTPIALHCSKKKGK